MATPERLYRDLMTSIEQLEELTKGDDRARHITLPMQIDKQLEINQNIAKCMGHLLFAYRRGE